MSSRKIKLFLMIKEKSLNFSFNLSGVWMSTIRKPYKLSFQMSSTIFLKLNFRLSVTDFGVFSKQETSGYFLIFNHSHSLISNTRNPSSSNFFLLSAVFFRISSWGMFLRGCVSCRVPSVFWLVLHLSQEWKKQPRYWYTVLCSSE